jgi:zinc protease
VQLNNGLTVIIHEDHKAPIVAINVWYHVGSKNEPSGRKGFAHLFEHLMFQGSENYNDDYLKALDKFGATDMNGTTNQDRTNYFQTVPTTALDVALFMESDRMGHFVNAISQFRLDEQRKVVLNEKRQRENTPYWGVAEEKIFKGAFPIGHPYSWTPIGSEEDLNAAKLSDVKDWFKTYYGPSNATLTIVGDVKTPELLEKVKNYFGDIAPGPRLSRIKEWVAKRNDSRTEIAQDDVPFAKILKVYNIPGMGSKETEILDVISDVLSVGKNSRLFKDIVYDQQLATDISASIYPGEIASLFIVDATAKTGVSLEKLDQAISKTFNDFFKGGPTSDELKRVKTLYGSAFIQSLEKIGGGEGKANLLASSQVFTGDPGAYRKRLDLRMSLNPEEIRKTSIKWLSSGDYNLHILPFPKLTNSTSTIDRKKLPTPTSFPEAKFPNIQKATLSNGMNVLLAQRTHIPTVDLSIGFFAGFVNDPKEKAGLSRLTFDLLNEGTKKHSLFQIEDTLANLGSSISAFAGMNFSGVHLECLKQNFPATLNLLAETVLEPAFPIKELERLKKETIENIAQEKADPQSLGRRIFPELLFGKDHPYGIPLSGSGDAETVTNITRDEIVSYYNAWAKPNNATIIAIGDISMEELKNHLEKHFSNWKKTELPTFSIPPATTEANKGKIFLIDRPNAPQTVIYAGHFYPSFNNPKEAANFLMNAIIGGSFSSRINLNLREDKGWSYGSYTSAIELADRRFWLVTAPVQTDKTDLAVLELQNEILAMASQSKPITKMEFEDQKRSAILELSGVWETNSSLNKPIKRLIYNHMDLNFYQTYPKILEQVTMTDVTDSAKKNIHPNDMMWLFVGDKVKILPSLAKQGFKNIIILDENGDVKK